MIKYTFRVISASIVNRCMELVFSAEGLPDVTVSARLPLQGEALVDVAKEYVPLRYWQELQSGFQIPQIGSSGTGEAQPDHPQVEIPLIKLQPTEL